MSVLPLHPVPSDIDEARRLLAGVMDADLPQDSVLSACEAYNHLDLAHDGIWPPPEPIEIDDAWAALQRVHAVLMHALHNRNRGLDPCRLGLALRDTTAAVVLLDHPGGAA